jgi:D-sedoheptulose 7-phosphate isomerase
VVTPPDGMHELCSDRIQEIHMLVLHTLIEVIERIMFPENY